MKSCDEFRLAYLNLTLTHSKVKVNVTHILIVDILEIVTDMKTYYLYKTGSHIWALSLQPREFGIKCSFHFLE